MLPFLFVLVYLWAAADGLRNVVIDVPPLVTPGERVMLRCLYELEGEPLYAVKWYIGRQEFFRYLPKELPHARMFPQAGVNVDVGQSGPHTVFIRNVQPEMAGRYGCEVSNDEPTFHTVIVFAHMNVILPPTGNVTLRADKQTYTVGENLKADCTASPSKPPSNITWYLNGKTIGSAQTITYPSLNRQQHVTVSKVVVPLESVHRGVIHIMCQSNVYNSFKSMDEAYITVSDDMESYDQMTEASVFSGGAETSAVIAFSYLILVNLILRIQ